MIETLDGFLSRTPKEDSNLRFKNSFHTQRPRVSLTEPFVSITFELSNTILNVQRIYPTVIDFLSDFGGLAEVLSFLIYCVIMVHHHLIMQ